MARKQKKGKKETTYAKTSKGLNWDVVWKALASIFAFAGSLATVYDLTGKIRSDSQTFYAFVLPGLVIVVWLIILVQLIRKRNPYVFPLLAVTVVGGIVGALGWQSYNKTQEDKVIVLVAQFDGPEETYGLHNQIMEDLRKATLGYDDTVIIDGKEIVTAGQGSIYARELGQKVKADLVIWAWYRPTENPNITVHIENLSPTQINILHESETYEPQATLPKLQSFEVQKQIGEETSTLISFLVGTIKYGSDDYQTAIKYFESILLEDDVSTFINHYDLFFNLGYSYTETGNYELSIQYWNKAIEINSERAIAFNNRGWSYYLLGEYERAILDYSKAIEINPQYIFPYSNRGDVYFDMGEYEQAIQDYNKGIAIDPQSAIIYNNRGRAYYGLQEYKKAIQDYDKAIEIDPKYAFPYNNRANAYDELGQYTLAFQDYAQAIDLDPDYADAYRNRGLVYKELGKTVEAEADFRKYEELTGEKP